MCGFFFSQDCTFGVAWVEKLPQDDMNVLVSVRFHGFGEEGQEIFTVMGWFALTEDRTGAHIQRSEQIRRAVPDVVVVRFSHASNSIDGIGWVQRLDLRVFLSTESTMPPPGGSR